MAERIPLPQPGDLRDDVAGLLPLIAPEGREPARTMAILAWQPELFSPFLGWAAALALHGLLSHREHELLALRVAWNCRSEFEWAEHVEYARDAAINDDEIAAISLAATSLTDGSHAGGSHAWTPREAALLATADALHGRCDVDTATWVRLASQFEVAELVEILFVVGQYTMLSMVANAARVGVSPGAPSLPERA